MAAPVFRGLHNLLRVVNELLNRPKWSRVAKAGLRGDRPLPLICLIGASRAEKFVTALAQHLEDTAPDPQAVPCETRTHRRNATELSLILVTQS